MCEMNATFDGRLRSDDASMEKLPGCILGRLHCNGNGRSSSSSSSRKSQASQPSVAAQQEEEKRSINDLMTEEVLQGDIDNGQGKGVQSQE